MSEQSEDKERIEEGGSEDKEKSESREPGEKKVEKDENVSGGAKPLPERLPRPTVWPATVALGVTLLSFGIVTHWIMSLAGLGLFLLGAGGWFGDLRNDVLL